jgi:hypothetical protein
MNNNTYLVVNICDGDLGKIYAYASYKDALEYAAQLAAKLCDVSLSDATAALVQHSSYYSSDYVMRIYIAQAE